MKCHTKKSEVPPSRPEWRKLPPAPPDPVSAKGASLFSLRKMMAGFLGWLGRGANAPRRLIVLERVSLAPHQTLFLVDAEGKRLLIASSASGAFRFLEFDGKTQTSRTVHEVCETGDRGSLRDSQRLPGLGASWGRKRW